MVEPDGYATMLVNASTKGAWHFDGHDLVDRVAIQHGGKPVELIAAGLRHNQHVDVPIPKWQTIPERTQ